MAKVYKPWKIGNIGCIVGRQGLKWQQIGYCADTVFRREQSNSTDGTLTHVDFSFTSARSAGAAYLFLQYAEA